MEKLLEATRKSWHENGLSVLTDGWTDTQRRPLIKFMAASKAGTMLLKAVNCEGEHKDNFFISELMTRAIEDIGSQNVVQVITNNAHVVLRLVHLLKASILKKFGLLGVVHTLNLARKNISTPKQIGGTTVAYNECKWTHIVEYMGNIKNFITNHPMRLAIFNEFIPLELVATDTRFASIVVMLTRYKLVKCGLQSITISEKWGCLQRG